MKIVRHFWIFLVPVWSSFWGFVRIPVRKYHGGGGGGVGIKADYLNKDLGL